MIVRADHVAGAAFIALGILVYLLGTDLPFGTVTQPGAGMMPKLVAGLMLLFAVVVVVGGASSQPFADIDWSDRGHAALLVLISAVAIALYTRLGFLITVSLLIFALLTVVERRRILPAAGYAIALTLFAYWLFDKALKAPLERGILGF